MAFMDLFRPRWRRSSSKVRLEAAKTLTDQAILERIARSDPDPWVRLTAAERLADRAVAQALYAELARDRDNRYRGGSRYRGVRLAAAMRLEDHAAAHTAILDVAWFGDCSNADFNQLLDRADQSLLAEIAARAQPKHWRADRDAGRPAPR